MTLSERVSLTAVREETKYQKHGSVKFIYFIFLFFWFVKCSTVCNWLDRLVKRERTEIIVGTAHRAVLVITIKNSTRGLNFVLLLLCSPVCVCSSSNQTRVEHHQLSLQKKKMKTKLSLACTATCSQREHTPPSPLYEGVRNWSL